jgi:hypothetical protein
MVGIHETVNIITLTQEGLKIDKNISQDPWYKIMQKTDAPKMDGCSFSLYDRNMLHWMISFTHSFIHKYFTELLTCGKNREYKGY